MKLITRFELASRSDAELRVLYREVFNALAQSAAGSPERRACLASLDNLRNEIHERALRL